MNTNTTRYVGTHLTWFLGSGNDYCWTDPDGHTWIDRRAAGGHEGAYASGLPYNTPGIALPARDTLRWWCRVSLPRQNLLCVVRHVDVGPRHPVLDCTAPFAYMMFTTQDNFPDYTPWIVEPIGLDLPEGTSATITNLRTAVVAAVPDAL